MYTLTDFRQLVRTHLDLDDEDLPDLLVDEFIRDASQRAQYHRHWPFYSTVWTFETAIGEASYPLANFTHATNAEYVCDEIVKVRGDNRELQRQEAYRAELYNPLDSVSTGDPMYWSMWGLDVIDLDPVPTRVETITVRGYRKPVDWVSIGAAATSDLPEPFDRAILEWALGRAYAHQDEPDTSVYFLDMSDGRLTELRKRFDDVGPAEDIVFNGGGPRAQYALSDGRTWWE